MPTGSLEGVSLPHAVRDVEQLFLRVVTLQFSFLIALKAIANRHGCQSESSSAEIIHRDATTSPNSPAKTFAAEPSCAKLCLEHHLFPRVPIRLAELVANSKADSTENDVPSLEEEVGCPAPLAECVLSATAAGTETPCDGVLVASECLPDEDVSCPAPHEDGAPTAAANGTETPKDEDVGVKPDVCVWVAPPLVRRVILRPLRHGRQPIMTPSLQVLIMSI